ncbi:hypothetical protein P8452_46147 [Trifolium repens]|nr:hypothetical protein QL285_074030 [Trifolium repens]WJX61002.1 hypothetical protein P8452_46147 [Trifolium repens]
MKDCAQCGCYGHLMKDCAQQKKNTTSERVQNDGVIAEPVNKVNKSSEPVQESSEPGQKPGEPVEIEQSVELGINGQDTTVENAINGEKIVIMENNDLPNLLHGDWIKVERKKKKQ